MFLQLNYPIIKLKFKLEPVEPVEPGQIDGSDCSQICHFNYPRIRTAPAPKIWTLLLTLSPVLGGLDSSCAWCRCSCLCPPQYCTCSAAAAAARSGNRGGSVPHTTAREEAGPTSSSCHWYPPVVVGCILGLETKSTFLKRPI